MGELQHPWLSRLAILYALGVILVLAGPIPLAGALAVLIGAGHGLARAA